MKILTSLLFLYYANNFSRKTLIVKFLWILEDAVFPKRLLLTEA